MINSDSLLKIFKTSGLPTLILLPDIPYFTISEVNVPLLKSSNKKEEDVIGKSIFEAFPRNPQDPLVNGISNLLISLQKVLKTGEPDKMSVQKYDMMLDDQFEERYWRIENTPVLSDDNVVEYIIHTTVDVTDTVFIEQRELERKRRNELPDEVSKILINEGSDIIAIVDSTCTYKYLSPSFETILGYCPKDFIGKNGFEFIHKDDKELFSQEFLKIMEHKRVHASPFRFKDKNGSWRWIETVFTNLIDDSQVKGIVAVSRDITQWMNLEEERRISEEKYKLLFNFSPLPKWVYALDTFEILDVNEIALKNYGYSREEFLNMTIAGIRPKEEIKELLKARESLENKKGIIYFGVFTHLKKDGTRIKAEVSGNQFSFEGRDCMMVVCIDVTEKENALLKLKDNEEKLIAAQTIGKLGYWKIDIQKEDFFWSDEVFNILSISKKTFKAHYDLFLQLVHPDDQEAFARERFDAITGKKEIDFEFRMMQQHGSYKWIHERGKLVKNEKGEPVIFEGTLQDITESKLLKLSLEESNERYSYASKATFDAIYDWDLISNKCFWGEGFTRDFGYNVETLADNTFWESNVHPEDKERIEKEIKNYTETNATNWLNEYRFRKANGAYVFVLDRSIIIRNKEGKAIRMIGAIQDITEKKTLQQLLDKANRLAKIGSWEIDVETNTVYWSDIVKEIREVPKGYEPTLQDGISHFKDGYSKDTIIARVKEAVKKGTPWSEELQIYTHKGNLKWMRTIGNAEIVDGKCVKVYGSFQDIDEQKKAELEIRKLYEEKNTILESIGDAFFTVNKNWMVTYWNKEAEKMLIVPKNKIIGMYLWDVFSDSIGSVSYEKYHQAIETNQQLFFEDYYQPLDKWFEITAYPSENGLSVYFKDTTERKLSQIRLKESEKRYSELFRLNPQPIWIFELETFRFLQVNKAAIDLYEYSEEEFLNMTVFDIRPKEDIRHVKRALDNLPEDGINSGKYRHLTKSKKIIDVEVKSNFVSIDDKKYRLVIITDVTEKNRMEHEITKAIIRTQENERYEIGAELHDNICQILATTHINLGVLSKAINPRGMDLFHQCREYIQLATQEIRNLSHRLAPAFFSDSTLEEAFEVLLNNCNVENKYNVTLYFDEAVEKTKITRDLQLNLYRILQEQLRNILKYSHCKNIEVDLVVNKNKLKMRIADDGVGFDTNGAKRGIGLSNMKRRVELFYGKFKLYSSPGNGCEIVIDIPLKDENLNLMRSK